MEKNQIKKIAIRCPYQDCGHQWRTKSLMKVIYCPSCYRRLNRLNNITEKTNE